MKAQSSMEYLMIIGITLMVLVPSVYLFYSYSRQSAEEMIYPQIDSIGKKLVDNVESVYYSGEHSRLEMRISVPQKIIDAYILYNREIVIQIESDLGITENVYFSIVNVSTPSCYAVPNDWRCNISSLQTPGNKKLKLESINNGKQVLIT